jgi:hypothetical protein
MKKIIENKRLCNILVIALVLVPFIMIFAFWMQRSFKKQERIEYSIEKFSKVEDAVYFFGNQQKYILLNKQSDLHLGGGHYLFTTERKVMVKKNGVDLTDEKRIPKSDYWKLRLYDYSTDDLVATEVNLNKVVSDYQSNFYPTNFQIYTYRTNPKNTVEIEVKNDKGIVKTFLFNIDTGKVEGDKARRPETYDDIPDFYDTTLANYSKDKGYLVDDRISINSDIQAEGKIIDTNINLFKDYPEIEEKLKDGWILYPQVQYVSPKEWFNKVLYWMAPKGEEKLTIYGIDRKGHALDTPISTYEEYQAWIKQQKEEFQAVLKETEQKGSN